uniref:hypothetical protein n=1 Tax=Ndongobacter massiliensis TaxID=1871025 RepID=UPI000A44F048|nr:hypothetical protein [Ndongobacter massiliensis]
MAWYATKRRKALGEQLAALQRACKEKGISVLIMIDGWESSGRGAVMNDLVRELDAKNYRISTPETCTKSTWKNPCASVPNRPFWAGLPAKGEFAVFDRSLYYELLNDLQMDREEEKRRLRRGMETERLFYEDGMILLKFFLDMSEKGQKKAIEALEADPYRQVLVSGFDWEQNKAYGAYRKRFDQILAETDQPFAPWYVVSGEKHKNASRTVLGICIEEIEKGIRRLEEDHADEVQTSIQKTLLTADDTERPARKMENPWQVLEPLDKDMYKKKCKALQKEAGKLAYGLYAKGIPCVLVFEGVDAAGKGGAISRLIRQFDARDYVINPTSAPTDREKEHHYLWRFYNNFPQSGKIAIFDRSWYGRVMVERVEQFATEGEWRRAYREINEMERELSENGVLVLKFFLMISKEEQKRRFQARQEEKPYKITEEDWRNREKWDEYLRAFEDMFAQTSTRNAPWTILTTDDKRRARIGVLETFVDAAKRALREHPKAKS